LDAAAAMTVDTTVDLAVGMAGPQNSQSECNEGCLPLSGATRAGSSGVKHTKLRRQRASTRRRQRSQVELTAPPAFTKA
jgi:hypothetical protein